MVEEGGVFVLKRRVQTTITDTTGFGFFCLETISETEAGRQASKSRWGQQKTR